MNKIKVFEFLVSNATSSPCSGDEKEKWYQQKIYDVCSPIYIERILNDFLEDNKYILVDLKVNSVDVHYNNNARGNEIKLVYTMIYKESEE